MIEVESGLIASCKDDGCNKAAISATKNSIYSIIVLMIILVTKVTNSMT